MNKITISILLGILLLPISQVFALTVGVTAGPHAIIMEKVKEQLAKEQVPLKIVEFNDYILPNAALAQGDIDVNCYQHQPFLDEQVRTRQYPIASIAKTILLPLGVYSQKIQTLEQLKPGATIAIPNDPTNG